MDPKVISLLIADVLLLATSLAYGVSFLGKKNYMLGLELLVVTVSTSNLLLYFLNGSQIAYSISFFLDAFSRGFGIPLIATLGLMAVTHRYKPSTLADVVWFVACFASTAVLVNADFMAQPLPYFYVVMWSLFSIYLVYFAWRLLRAGARGHACSVIVAMVAGQAIACIYDFYKIPGDQDQMIFFTLALTAWAYLTVALYYAYVALERAVVSPSPMRGDGRDRSVAGASRGERPDAVAS